MSQLKCPKCYSENIYKDMELWVCAECFNEWSEQEIGNKDQDDDEVIKDANGNVLEDGDTVILVKELKIKGSSSAIKIGTKVKNIRLGDLGNDHNISCKIDGFGSMQLKSEFVKKI